MAARQGVGGTARWSAPSRLGLTERTGLRWSGCLATLLVASTLITVWLLSGVSIGDISSFVAIEALYVVLPGCLLYVLLSPAPGGWLRTLAIGWPLGYALEIGAFALTAGLHARGLFAYLPLLVAITIGPCVLYMRWWVRPGAAHEHAVCPARRSAERERGAESAARGDRDRDRWCCWPSGSSQPIRSRNTPAVSFISWTTYGMCHWRRRRFTTGRSLSLTSPVTLFRYYIGVFIHVAAIKQVTGVPLATAIFRLLPATATLVVALQFWCLGGLLGRSRWAGPITVALLIVVENIKLYPTHTFLKVFGVALFSEFTWSPDVRAWSDLLPGPADPVQSPAPRHGCDRGGPSGTPDGATPMGAAGSLLMLGILVLGGSAVKSTAVATFVAGLGLFWLWRLVRAGAERLLTYCLAVSLGCFAAMYLLLLAGAGGPASTETKLAPLDFLKYTVFGSTLVSHPGLAPLLGVAVVIFLWKLLPVAGALWPLWRRGLWSPYAGLALAVFAVGFVGYVAVGSVNDNETYFVWYGYMALIPVAAVEPDGLWSDVPGSARRSVVRACTPYIVLGLAAGRARRRSLAAAGRAARSAAGVVVPSGTGWRRSAPSLAWWCCGA